jgi:hypothetical protein
MRAADRIARWQPALLVALPAVWAVIVCAPGYFTDADSYYHLGVARRLLEHGWLRQFPWLPYTTLADPFPDPHLAQHVVLAPLVAVFGPAAALRIAPVVLSSAFAASVYAVLRRHGVRWPAPWIVLGLLACPLAVSYATFVKGASTFLIIVPWFVDAVWRGARRRAFVLAWLSVYAYVGATVLVPFAIAHLLAVRWREGRWDAGCLVAALAGLAAGMIVNPFWPAQWSHAAAELRSVFERDPALVPGEYRGAEWAILGTDVLVQVAGAALIAWAAVLIRQLGRAAAASTPAVSGALAALGLLAGGLVSGSKLIELFVVFSLLAVPLLAEQMRPWGRAATAAAVALALAMAARSLALRREMLAAPGPTRPAELAAMAHWLDERTAPGEVVVAPWDDMPGLFLFGRDERYVAGVNVQFLRDADPTRFTAYALLYRGAIADPQNTLATLFDGARFLLVHREPRLPGEPALTAGLAANPAFEEIASPASLWRVFRRRPVRPAQVPTGGRGQ